jgi:uncharacterized protein (DUF58 family)
MILDRIRSIFINARFYLSGAIIVILFITGYFFDPFFLMAKLCLLILLSGVFVDFYLLNITRRDIILLHRDIPDKLSNGDLNTISIFIRNNHFFPISASIFDEIPPQFQLRNNEIRVDLNPFEEKKLSYTLKPVRRGEYDFGKTNVLVSNKIGLLSRRFIFNGGGTKAPVYPSFLNIRKYEFLAISNRLTEAGIKKIRRVGQYAEFDQIKEYVKGDDMRTINWKATAKRGKLMTNQYQYERSQQIYNLIDMGRVMKMPFEQMTLLDYAINSALVLANTALLKHDKAGLITFNTSINAFFPAERRNNTMLKMLELLYKQETLFAESNYEMLYITIKRRITHRSLLILYTNLESVTSLERYLGFLQRLAQHHLVLVILFENTEVTEFRKKEAQSIEQIYIQTIAEKFIHDKHLIVKELNNHGIMAILTRPKDLSVNLINRYLEMKDRNLI